MRNCSWASWPDSAFRQDDPAFGPSDFVEGIESGIGQQQGIRIGESDIFGGKYHEPAGYERRVLPAGHHARQPVDGGIGIGAAD